MGVENGSFADIREKTKPFLYGGIVAGLLGIILGVV